MSIVIDHTLYMSSYMIVFTIDGFEIILARDEMHVVFRLASMQLEVAGQKNKQLFLVEKPSFCVRQISPSRDRALVILGTVFWCYSGDFSTYLRQISHRISTLLDINYTTDSSLTQGCNPLCVRACSSEQQTIESLGGRSINQFTA